MNTSQSRRSRQNGGKRDEIVNLETTGTRTNGYKLVMNKFQVGN